MRETRLQQGSLPEAEVLLTRARTVCRDVRRSGTYPIGPDQKIFFSGAWRNLSSVIQKRQYSQNRERERRKDPQWIEYYRTCKREQYARDPQYFADVRKRRIAALSPEQRKAAGKKEYARRKRYRGKRLQQMRDWYQRNQPREWEKIKARRVRNNPLYGFTKILLDLRAGKISVDEFNRRFDSVIARIDEISQSRANKSDTELVRNLRKRESAP